MGRGESTPKPGSSRFVVSDAPTVHFTMSDQRGGSMTEEEKAPSISVKDVPDPIAELRNILKEQQAVIVKQNEAIKALTARMNESEKLAAAGAAPSGAAAEPPKEDPQTVAYKAMLREMGIDENMKEE